MDSSPQHALQDWISRVYVEMTCYFMGFVVKGKTCSCLMLLYLTFKRVCYIKVFRPHALTLLATTALMLMTSNIVLLHYIYMINELHLTPASCGFELKKDKLVPGPQIH